MEGTHVLDPQAVQNFYYEAYNVIRGVTGIGEGKGPMIVSYFCCTPPDVLSRPF